MAVLRDIVAKLSLDLDDKDFDQADKRIDGTTAALRTMGAVAVAATAAMGAGMFVAIKAAADANETLNLMGLTFQDNTDDVVAWGAAFSKAAGRSEFELREMATQLGSVLTPMLENNIDQATEFAKALSERSVDFASARNIGDMQATNAFISGLTGEMEPLKRFGIIMSEANLATFALEKGITKSTAKMGSAEKTQLRYNFLMERTAIFQGDAANTSESYANSTKALRATLVDLGTRIGAKFLPTAERVIRVVRDIVGVLGEWVEHSNIVIAALLVFGSITTAIALRMAATWALANLPLILMAIALGVLILVVDDFLTFIEGGDSVIGAFIDSIWGPGSAAEALANWKAGFEDLQTTAGNVLDWLSETVANVRAKFSEDMEAMGKAFDAFIGDWLSGAKQITKWIKRISAAGAFLNIGGGVPGLLGGVGAAVLATAGGPATATTRAVAASQQQTTVSGAPGATNTTINVQVPPGTPSSMASRTADATGAAVKRENRRTRAALAQRGGG